MSEQKLKLIKKSDRPQPKSDAEYIESHKLSLLHLLIKENPERAREIINRLGNGKAQAA